MKSDKTNSINSGLDGPTKKGLELTAALVIFCLSLFAFVMPDFSLDQVLHQSILNKNSSPPAHKIQLDHPPQMWNFYSDNLNPIEFKFKPNFSSQFNVVISNDPYFEKVLINRPIESGFQIQETIGTPGKYFWFVDSPNEKIQSEIRSFTLRERPIVSPVYPPNRSVITYDSDQQDGALVTISAQDNEGSHKFEIYSDINLKEQIFKQTSSNFQLSNIQLPEGRYYWRTTLHRVGIDDRWSETHTFRVHDLAKRPKAPKLLSPPISQHQQSQDKESHVEIVFDQIFMAEAYDIEITSNQNSGVTIDQSQSPTYYLTLNKPGIHYIRARAIDTAKRIGDWSEIAVRIIHETIDEPEIKPIDSSR